jgi:hypothetical protein
MANQLWQMFRRVCLAVPPPQCNSRTSTMSLTISASAQSSGMTDAPAPQVMNGIPDDGGILLGRGVLSYAQYQQILKGIRVFFDSETVKLTIVGTQRRGR